MTTDHIKLINSVIDGMDVKDLSRVSDSGVDNAIASLLVEDRDAAVRRARDWGDSLDRQYHRAAANRIMRMSGMNQKEYDFVRTELPGEMTRLRDEYLSTL